MRRRLLALSLVLASTVVAAQGPRPAFQAWVERYSDEWMRFHTNAAAARRYFTGAEQDGFERQIEPLTAAQRTRELQLIRRGLEELKQFDRAALAVADQRAFDIIRWDLQGQLDGSAFDDDYFPFAQNYGADADLIGTLTVNHVVRTRRDAENYLARLALVATRMDEATTESRRLVAAGRRPPKFILATTSSQMKEFLDLGAGASPFVATFAEKLATVPGLTGAERNAMLATAGRITATEIYPAWERAKALLDEQIPLANDDAGLWRFADGKDAYAAALRRSTTTNMTADEIHDIGLKLVAELEGRMDALLRPLGYSEGAVNARMERLMADQPAFPDTPDGRAQFNALVTDIIRDAERRASTLFARVPKMPVVARAYPDFMRGRAASYSVGTTDGTRPGVYQYAVTGVKMTRYGLRTTAYHEAVPGHHFQIALQAEDSSMPKFLRDRVFGGNSANAEG